MIRSRARRAATAVEFAFIAPVLMLFVLGLVVGAVGIFRYQEVAALAREGSRYASVRGAKYQQVTGNTAATPQDVYDNAIKANAAALDLSQLTYSVTWSPDNRQGSYVIVQCNYQWIPEAFLGGITLSSTSKVRISY